MFPFFPKDYLSVVLTQCNRDIITATKVCTQQKNNLVQMYTSQSPNIAAATINSLMLNFIQQQQQQQVITNSNGYHNNVNHQVKALSAHANPTTLINQSNHNTSCNGMNSLPSIKSSDLFAAIGKLTNKESLHFSRDSKFEEVKRAGNKSDFPHTKET